MNILKNNDTLGFHRVIQNDKDIFLNSKQDDIVFSTTSHTQNIHISPNVQNNKSVLNLSSSNIEVSTQMHILNIDENKYNFNGLDISNINPNSNQDISSELSALLNLIKPYVL